jgi:hypothetical protein
LEGGWGDDEHWEEIAQRAVAAIERLYKLLRDPALAAKRSIVG